ncbi:MAG TPA: nitroreductase family protein [Terriglobales bacterium]|nr:nitroreductase family protein [Terriglobales bacterium]
MAEPTNSTNEKRLSQVIAERRTTPNFSNEPVRDEDLQHIIEAGLHAPSGYNTQPWRFVVVRDAEQRRKLAVAAMNQKRVAEAPVVIVACGDAGALKDDDLEEMLRLAAEHGFGTEANHEAVRRNFPRFLESLEMAVWLNRQVMIAFTQMMLMAEVLGYDTAPLEGFWEDKVKQLLEIPDSARVVALLCIGHRQGPDKPFGGRFAMKRTVFAESWGRPFQRP